MQFVKSRKLKALGVTASTRTPIAPQLPTISESGVPGYQSSIWNGMLVPARTPSPVIAKLNAEVARVLGAPETREYFAGAGSDAAPSSPAEFGAFIQAEIDRWAPVIKAAGIKPQ